MVTVKDIVELEYFKNHGITLLGGASGLMREVSAVNLIQLFTFDQWMRGKEVLLVNGVGLHLDQTANITTIIDKAYKKDVACIIFMKNHFLSSMPEVAISHADAIGFPIFWIPSEPPFSESISIICDYVSTKRSREKSISDLTRSLLLYDTEMDSSLVRQQLHDLKYTAPGCRVIVFRTENPSVSENPVILNEIYRKISQHLPMFCPDEKNAPLYLITEMRLTVLLPIKELSDLQRFMQKLLENLSQDDKKVPLKIGCGRYYTQPEDYKKSYQEACHCHKACPDGKSTYLAYEDLGLLQLCIDTSYPEYIVSYIQKKLHPIVEYDLANHSELLHTLTILAENNFNISHAAQLLYVHRNTMIQRVTRICSLLNCDLEDHNTRLELSVALYLNKYYKVQNAS